MQTIIGYDYKGVRYSPEQIIGALPTGPDEDYDGWQLAEGATMTVEDNLSELASAFGIDRDDDSIEPFFPVTVFRNYPARLAPLVNTALILKVIQSINAEPDKFDMALWLTSGTGDEVTSPIVELTCGMTACLGGWTLVDSGVPEDRAILVHGTNSEIEDAAKLALGLDDDYDWLFYAERWPTWCDGTSKPAQVREATRLLTMIALGEDPWVGIDAETKQRRVQGPLVDRL